MAQSCIDPDPYAELDYRADAGELSEEFRKPIRIFLAHGRGKPAVRDGTRQARRGIGI